MALTEGVAGRRLWGARLAWLVLALATVGFLATATPGATLDAGARPVMSIVAAVGLAYAYRLLTRRALPEE